MTFPQRPGGWIISVSIGRSRSDLMPFTHGWTQEAKFATTGPWMYFDTEKEANEYVRAHPEVLELATKLAPKAEKSIAKGH